MRIRAVVFDLDGTLVDSAPGLQTAVNSVLEEQDCPPLGLEDVKLMIGEGIPALIDLCAMRDALAAQGMLPMEVEALIKVALFGEKG